MSHGAVTWAIKTTVRPATYKLTLILLADVANGRWQADPSISDLCQTTSLNRKTVMECLNGLEAAGFITHTGDRAGRTQRVKVYQLNGEVTVSTKQSQKRDYSKQSQKRDYLKNKEGIESAPILEETGNSTEIGTVSNSTEIGTVSEGGNSTEIGIIPKTGLFPFKVKEEDGRRRDPDPDLTPIPSLPPDTKSPPKKSKQKKTRSVATSLPPAFTLTEKMQAWGRENYPDVDLTKTTEGWVDAMKSKDFKYIDWEAAWRNGIRRAVEWKTAVLLSSPTPTNGRRQQIIDEVYERMNHGKS